MPVPSCPPPPPPPTHVRVFAEARVEAFPYSAWKVVTRQEWAASSREQREEWRLEAAMCLLSTIAMEKGVGAAVRARVTY
ncbi:hypothetical protein [Streptomyces sp. SAI-127]|uniref:hypothetical protein n=1 Tax=Streptomyces sp. SAI-127 TaxID=2940543 RepID=UPI0024764838|nr:hypothetical protein [Streptomyces sp. SAI-127]MDH6489638.1 hypothetical protein [Streptomyces sp. SAI-127]